MQKSEKSSPLSKPQVPKYFFARDPNYQKKIPGTKNMDRNQQHKKMLIITTMVIISS